MRGVRVYIYGGADFQPTPARFISALTYKILDLMPAVITTGGFLHSKVEPRPSPLTVLPWSGLANTPNAATRN
jgi:hypothetical protein